jgi:hypothetical protein
MTKSARHRGLIVAITSRSQRQPVGSRNQKHPQRPSAAARSDNTNGPEETYQYRGDLRAEARQHDGNGAMTFASQSVRGCCVDLVSEFHVSNSMRRDVIRCTNIRERRRVSATYKTRHFAQRTSLGMILRGHFCPPRRGRRALAGRWKVNFCPVVPCELWRASN